jgi:hypothetical protein
MYISNSINIGTMAPGRILLGIFTVIASQDPEVLNSDDEVISNIKYIY